MNVVLSKYTYLYMKSSACISFSSYSTIFSGFNCGDAENTCIPYTAICNLSQECPNAVDEQLGVCCGDGQNGKHIPRFVKGISCREICTDRLNLSFCCREMIYIYNERDNH